MSPPIDLKALFEDWEYDPDNNLRLTALPDGRTVIQVRLPFGVEQYERDGRPDGERPHGRESVFDHHLARLREAKDAGTEPDFRLTHEDCAELFQEALTYYYRYLHLFQLQDWERTVRDTRRNIRLFDFVRAYADTEEDRVYLEQWRAYITRMNAVARAMLALKDNDYDRALDIVRASIARIESLSDHDNETFSHERRRSLLALREMAKQIDMHRPLNELEQLERELGKAVEAEEFERAAELRDRISNLRQAVPEPNP
jgi:hypothetical protein